MVKLDVVRASNTALVRSQPLVAVFFGGTSGIGSYTIRALARATANGGKGFRAYIVGRNAKAAEEIIAECSGICPQGEFKFVEANDISLIQDVDRVCADIIQLEEKEGQDPRIDYLMLSQGGSIFLPRKGMLPGCGRSCGSYNDNRYKRRN
jgi:NAD(P)-dependent dehydrogenase (short-subunit alcohol dehydrogenase family)